MTFDTPTTKAEMYEILQDIFYYYRIQREGNSQIDLEDLELTRLSYTPMTDTERGNRAQTNLRAAQAENDVTPGMTSAR